MAIIRDLTDVAGSLYGETGVTGSDEKAPAMGAAALAGISLRRFRVYVGERVPC
jgi:hypothetical protein